MSLPARQVPTPQLPQLDEDRWSKNLGTTINRYLGQFASRVSDWVNSVSSAFTSLKLRQVELTPAPDGTITMFTVPYQIATDTDGTPFALLFNGSPVMWTATYPPPAGKYTIRNGANGAQTIVFGTAPASGSTPFFGFLVAR